MDKATKSGGGHIDLQGVYPLVAEYSPLPTAVLEGATHLIRYVNPAFCRLVARESAELLAVPFSRAVPEGQAFLPHLDRVYQTGEAETYVTQVRSAPRPLYWSSAVWAIPGASSSPAGVIIQLTDTTEAELFRQNAAAMNQELLLASVRQHELTEAAEKMNAELQEEIDQRKNAETAVRESEERLSALITSSSDAVYSMSPDWKEMRQLHGRGFIPDTLAPSRNWLQEYIHPDDQPHVTAVINEAIRTKSIFELEHRVLRVDGALGWTFSRAVPLFDENGAIVEWFGTASDITERKHAEQFLQNARDELERRVEEKTSDLRQAYEALQYETNERAKTEEQLRQAQKMEALGTMSGGIAHDFNNLLAAIIGFTELVAGHAAKGSRDEHHLARIMESSLRGRDLVRQMLTFSRKAEQEKKPLLLSSIVEETGKLIRATTPTTISIRVNALSESGLILADPTQMQQVLMNLCTNAAYAMREKGGILDIQLNNHSVSPSNENPNGIKPGLYTKLTVRDTGAGMSPDIVEKIFDPFFTTKKLGEGTGLGLSVVHGIVNQHDGYITVESEPGKGSTFTVYFPQVSGKLEGDAVSDDELPTGSERILFIDDEEALVEMGEDILAELGYGVTSRMSSREALALLKADPSWFDLVITDQTMPEMTGVELAKEILTLRADMPIIMCTGFSYAVDADKAKAAGMRAFAMKPLTKREIARTIRKVLDG